jgi:eukaryotic-like serine/threonine-protein kinase
MDTVLPKAERAVEMQATRISVDPPSELPQPSSRRPYRPGDVIDGKYELEALLGRGGMGEVWTAHNATLGVRRAVKLIRADAGSPDSTDRLLHEAQAAARLAEPAIVRVFDFGKTTAGDPYIVMEMLEGEDLMSIIKRRERLSPIKAVRVLLPLIRALSSAHSHGIVHRDLKPENIFLAKLPDGRVQPKLLDFGIAKLKNTIGLRLTTNGAVMGSPLYMAPEQGRGEDVDERADIWALSVVLYEAITGHPPFSGDDRAEVTRAVEAASPARLSQHNVSDDSLWPIISRGLEKQRDARWTTMDELGQALARWLQAHGVVDDITGASLEAAWFRSSRQSLFGSSSPPLGAALSGPSESPGAGPSQPLRARLAGLAGLASALPARAKQAALRLRRPGRARWVYGAALLGMLLAITWLARSGPESADRSQVDTLGVVDSPLPTEPAALVGDVQPLTVAIPAAPGPTPHSEATSPAAAPALASDNPARGATSHDAVRARRKFIHTNDNAAEGESKEHRRSKLIDPYR